MASPIFLSPFTGDFTSPVSVRNWVYANVPCFDGLVPQAWLNAIYATLGKSHVHPSTILAGLELARKGGYTFYPAPSELNSIPINPAPTMGVPSESPKQALKHAAEVLEWQFEKAQLNNNYGEMKRLAKQFADLLNSADPIDEEIQWGAPLLRRSVRRNADGSDPAPRGPSGGPYRTLYVPVPIVEGEGEGEAE